MSAPEQQAAPEQADLRGSDRLSIPSIRARHEASTHPRWRASTDVGVLLAEIDRLNAERAMAVSVARAAGYRLAADNAAEQRELYGADADAEMLVFVLQQVAGLHERAATDPAFIAATTTPST